MGTEQYSAAGNVRVLARVRPALSHEYQYDQAVEVLSANHIKLQNPKQSYESSYDRVLPEPCSQELVYSQVKDCVSSLLAGYNNTLLAYGQTGTGKTYTMIGDQSMTLAQACSIPSSASGHGILPRAVYDLFSELDRRKAAAASMHQQFDVRLVCSYLEIYNDRLYDLLQPYKKGSSRDPHRIQVGKTSPEVREDPVAGTHVPNLLYVDVQNFKQVLQLVATGNCNRATAHTDMNRHSSRSHAILQLWLEQRPSASSINSTGSVGNSGGGVVVRSKMNFVDLAGSERWGRAHNEADGKTLINELTSINNSLSALALVVGALTDKTARHIPYRSSRLTHLLQDSLGGNCNTTLLVTVAPCVDAFEDSLAALKFADRARNISNKAVVNSMHDTETILALKEREIQRLRALLASYTSTSGAPAGAVAPGTQPPWGHEDVAGQDALLLPATHPSTPISLMNSPAAVQRQTSPLLSPHSMQNDSSQPSHLSSSGAVNDHSSVLASSTATAFADKTKLESELAATRAALAVERNMRSALEGQLQEVSAAVHAQQQAAAVAAAAAEAEQQAAAATAAAAASRRDASFPAHGSTYVDIADRSTTNAAAGLQPVARTGRSTLLAQRNHILATVEEPIASRLEPTWPVLSSPGAHHPQLQQFSTEALQQQHVQRSSPKKLKAFKWDNNWQGSAEERIRASHHDQHKQQDSSSTRSSTASPASAIQPDRSHNSTGIVQKAGTKADSVRSGSSAATPLRNSWSGAYGAAGGLRGKWPQSAAAAAGKRTKGSNKALGVSPAGFHTAREPAVAAVLGSTGKSTRRHHSQTADAAESIIVDDGVLQGPQRSASPVRPSGRKAGAVVLNSKPIMQYRAAAGHLPGEDLLPLMTRSSPSATKQLSGTASAAGASNKGQLLPADIVGGAVARRQQMTVSRGWGRSSLLQQATVQQLPSSPPTAAAGAAAAPGILSGAAAPVVMQRQSCASNAADSSSIDNVEQELHTVGSRSSSAGVNCSGLGSADSDQCDEQSLTESLAADEQQASDVADALASTQLETELTAEQQQQLEMQQEGGLQQEPEEAEQAPSDQQYGDAVGADANNDSGEDAGYATGYAASEGQAAAPITEGSIEASS